MKKTSKALAAGLIGAGLVLTLAACDDSPAELHGYVVGKTYEAAYSYTTLDPVYMSDGKGNMRVAYYQQNTHYVPECYKVSTKEDGGKKISACVSADEFKSLKMDDYIKKGDL